MSAAPKFTPGPWRRQDLEREVQIIGARGANPAWPEHQPTIASFARCRTGASRGSSPRWYGIRGIKEQDVALMVAAPELYEALRQIADTHAPPGSHAEIMANIARAALAKVSP